MKRLLSLACMIMLMFVAANAQMTKKDTGNGPLSERVNKFWKKTKKAVGGVVEQVENDFANESSGLRRIAGKYYMNIYDTDVYKGEDGEALRKLCMDEFVAKYPTVKVRSCVIPQTDWLTEPVETDGVVTGYAKTLFCYILAKDGDEGYINAKFVFERQKEVGGTFSNSRTKWPLWVRTDVLTNEVRERLLTR